MFKLYECDVGLKINGVAYNFANVVEVQIEDPERTRVTRGANATDKVGLTYKDGLTDPKRVTVPILGMDLALQQVMLNAYENDTRMEFYAISRRNGAAKGLRNAVLSNRPQQLVMDQTAESLQVSIELESFDSFEDIRE